MEYVYHFTDTVRLPWIVESGELRAGSNRIGGYPDDFLWATTAHQGDRTASGMQGYRQGITGLVRLALHAEDFELWPDILAGFPQWTDAHVRSLAAAARRQGEMDFTRWRARAEPLPLSRVLTIEAKTFTSNWRSVDLADACLQHHHSDMRGCLLGGTVYVSTFVELGHYTTKKMSLDEWRRSASIPAA
jgi:hypothetical protein